VKPRPTKRKKSVVKPAVKSAVKLSYHAWSENIAALLEEARRQSARSVNAILTATYWEIGRRIVEFVQQGETRGGYGDEVLAKLSRDLTGKFGRGFSVDNLQFMRAFHSAYPPKAIYETLSRKSFERQIFQTVSEKLFLSNKSQAVSVKSFPPVSSALIRKYETPSRISSVDLALYLEALCHAFPLSSSHYVRLLESPTRRRHHA
jgi:DUF1016 N-terminal domain